MKIHKIWQNIKAIWTGNLKRIIAPEIGVVQPISKSNNNENKVRYKIINCFWESMDWRLYKM